jgi:Concanavalin A-like lectin/glucanases superfamily/Domain of unknown function (DUF2341)
MSLKNRLIRVATILTAGSVCAGCLFLACTNLQNVAGGIEGGNTVATITGNIADSTGAPLADVRVLLLPSAYNPVTGPAVSGLPADTTGSAGNYSIKVTQTGNYTVEAIDNSKGYRSLVASISVSGTETTLVRNAIARAPGVIKIALPADVDRGNGYFYLPGTTSYAFVGDDTETVMLDSIPAGMSLSIYYAVRGSSALPQLVRDSVVVAPKDTTSVKYVGWNFSKKLTLNTTASGANVSGNVTDFPVLVRLTSSNFTFADAKQDGADLRFTKSDGTPLQYEIERWDAAAGVAEVWVKVDTVYGNSNSQYIVMSWGASASSVTSASNGTAVFDTAQGFQAVWHLGQGTGASVLDATANHYDGTPSGTAPTSAGGAIGTAQQFDGTANYIEILGSATGKLDFPQNGRYTLSAWIYVDTLDTNERFILGKGHEQYLIQSSLVPQDEKWEFAEYQTAAWQISRAAPAAGQWKFLVGVRDGVSQNLYVDGSLADSAIFLYPQAGVARYTANNFFMGKTPPFPAEHPNYFKGRIDEARVQSDACSADWVRLCFMNQKEPDALITR